MNVVLRHKSGNLRPFFLMQGLKRYARANGRTYVNLKYNYNAERRLMLMSSYNAAELSIGSSSVVKESCSPHVHHDYNRCYPLYSGPSYRRFHTSHALCESTSKVESTVKKLKNKQKEKVEEIMKEVASGAAATGTVRGGQPASTVASNNVTKSSDKSTLATTSEQTKAVAAPKKSLQTRIWEEVVHYYHGFRLLFIDVKISSKLLWRVLNGKTLTRRENKLLLRTTSDLFRLIPFSVFIIVPFMELLLPLFIKFFPGMLPSTFQTAKERENKLRQSLQMRLEMAKFLQRTLDEMPVQHLENSSQEAKDFEDFFKKIKTPSAYVSNEEIIKFAKRFDDEITLDSLSREQLAALCRVLELNTIGTTALLRFQLRLKLRSLATDDRVIAREGVDSLDLFELQQACKSRGMRAYGLTAERLRFQLKEWIDLSLNEKVAPTLLLLSRAMLISDDSITTDKLKETIRVLPDSVGAQTKHAIIEGEGKIDNKTKIEIIREEERKIREERVEELEEIKAKSTEEKGEQARKIPDIEKEYEAGIQAQSYQEKKSEEAVVTGSEISSSDMRLLSEALKTLSSDKELVVEKETIKEIKEELADYKDDIEELREVRQVVKEPVRESRAAKLLYNRVNKMISHLDKVLFDLENRQQEIKKTEPVEYYSTHRKDLVHIDDLVAAMKRMKESSDEMRFKVVEDLLMKFDNDKDGSIKVSEIMQVVKSIDSSKHQIDKKHLEEFTMLLRKQAQKRQQEELVGIDDLMQNIKKLKETSDEARLKHIENVLDKFDSDKDGVITVNEILKVLESIGRENIKLDEKQIEELITLLGKEQIFQAEQKIEKAIAKSMKEAEKLKSEVDKSSDTTITKLVEELTDSAKEIKEIAKDMHAIETSRQELMADQLLDKAKGLKNESELKDTAKTLKDNATDLTEIDMDTCLTKKTKPTTTDTTTKKCSTTTPSKPKNNTSNLGGGSPPKSSASSSTSSSSSSSSPTLSSTTGAESLLREAAERQYEKIIPPTLTSEIGLPPTELPLTPTATPVASTTTQPKNAATASASAVATNAKKLL